MMKGTPVGDLLHGHHTTLNGKATATRITDGLKPRKYPIRREGYHIADPEELLSLLVPVQTVEDGRIVGFQRELRLGKARQIAKAIESGEPLPAIEVAIHRNGAWVTDGQHRAAAAVIARAPVPTLARHLTEDEMRKIFANQAKATRVDPSILVLSADDPFSEYIQDAVTDDNHPWAPLVTHATSSKTKLTPSQARGALVPYVANALSNVGGLRRPLSEVPFNEQRARDLGRILLSYGGKEANPTAYRAVNLRSTVQAATTVLIRHEHEDPKAIERWTRQMPSFAYDRYAHVNSVFDMVPILIAHWNKRLSAAQRVSLGALDG